MPNPPEDRTPLAQRLTAFETTLLAGGVLLFVVLLYEMLVLERFLTPPLTAIAALILLWPLRRYGAARALFMAGGFLMLVWFLEEVSSILVPFATVYLLAFVFDPFVSYLRARFRVPRWVSSLVVTLAMVGLVTLFIFSVVPSIVSQIEVLATRLVDTVGLAREWVTTTTLLDELEATGLIDKQQLIDRLSAFVQERAEALATGIPNAVQGLVSSIGTLLGLITTLTLIPVILFYTLKDYPYIRRRLVELFPTFGGRRDYLMKAGGIVGSYLRAQLIISAIAAFNVSVVLLLFNVPFALLIGLMAGVLNMIPQLGVIITNVFAVLLALVFGDPWFVDVVIVLAALFGQSILEQTVLVPHIMSYNVGLHPVLILLSLFVFGYFMGIFGFLIAVPTTALLMAVYKTYRDALSFELGGTDDGVIVQPGTAAPIVRPGAETFGSPKATQE